MNYKKFMTLHYRLCQLIDQQGTIFLLERKKLDWLEKQQFLEKYPDVIQTLKENHQTTLAVIEELQAMLAGRVLDVKDFEQLTIENLTFEDVKEIFK